MHTCPVCGQECDCECGDRPPEIGCTHDCWQPVEQTLKNVGADYPIKWEPGEPPAYEDYFDDFS